MNDFLCFKNSGDRSEVFLRQSAIIMVTKKDVEAHPTIYTSTGEKVSVLGAFQDIKDMIGIRF